ncbi:hypothetical protein [Burkholderia territorii]|uniref:hypothetical protein n=1 Tax=Burkholderia territorii TaxID=1503055 RepID=UPI0012D9430E|nr:hypothetical protein [Burkholderia territorii]
MSNTNHAAVGNTTSGSSIGNVSGGPSSASIGNTSAAGGAGGGGGSATGGTSAASVGNTTAAGGTGGTGGAGGMAAGGTSQASTGASQATNGNNTNALSTAPVNQRQNQSVTGGNQSAGASGTNATTIDLSDHRSISNNTVFIPPVIPPTPPSTLAVGNIIKETSACGPLQSVIRHPVEGTFFGLLSESKVEQGYTDELAPYQDPDGQIIEYRQVRQPDGASYKLFGHQVTQYTSIVGVSGARNIALGAGTGSGNWSQAGLGTSAANQQMITTIQLRSCEIGTLTQAALPLVAERIRR